MCFGVSLFVMSLVRLVLGFLVPETQGRDADVVDFQEWHEAAKEKASRKE